MSVKREREKKCVSWRVRARTESQERAPGHLCVIVDDKKSRKAGITQGENVDKTATQETSKAGLSFPSSLRAPQ